MATTHLIARADRELPDLHRPGNLDHALEHHGLAPRAVGRLFTTATAVLAAREEVPS